MNRVAAVGTLFRCLSFQGDGEVAGLRVRVYDDPCESPLATLTPEPSAVLPGLQTAYWMFAATGTFYLRWYDSVTSSDFEWQTVHVVETEASYPVCLPAGGLPLAQTGALPSSVVAVGRPWYPQYQEATGLTLTMSVYGPDLAPVAGTPVKMVEYGIGQYRTSSEVVPLSAGTYVCLVLLAGDVIGYTVQDVFSQVSMRTVSIGALGMDGQGYSGVHVTMTRVPEGNVVMTTTGQNSTARFQLADGDYFITFRDPRYPGRTFSTNNYTFTVKSPEDTDTNAVTYSLRWLDVAAYENNGVPTEKRSIMHVCMRNGPEGSVSAYRRFSVELRTPWRDGALLVTPGSREYRLDSAGNADISLIRGSRVQVSFPDTGGAMTFDVPDAAEFNVTDVHVDDPFAVSVPVIFYPMRTAVS